MAGEAGGGRGTVGARRPRALPTGAGKTTGGGGLGRAGPLGELGQVSGRQVSGPGGFLLCFIFFFCFVLFNLFCHCFEFKIIQTMPKTPLNILYC